MRLKQKVLFLIGGLAVISAVSSQNSTTVIVSEAQQRPCTNFNALHKNTKNLTPLVLALSACSRHYTRV